MSQAGRGGRGPGGNTGSSSGPGGGSGGSSGSGNSSGSTGGGTDGRGSNTPGAPDGNGRGRTGSGATGGPGTDTPGAPNAPDGKRGSTMGPDGGSATGGRDGRGDNTPGSPDNPGRRGAHADGSTPASRARDAMSRHQKERDRRSIENGGMIIGDNDENAGLGLTHAMDDQQTENTLNRRGVTDTIGMSEVDRLGEARRGDAMLSQIDQQKERGIRHGFNSQTMANRVSDITGVPSKITGAAAAMLGRPKNTMQADVDIGRERASQNEMGAAAGAASLGLSEMGVSVPGNVVNFGYSMARTAADKNMSALQGSPTERSNPSVGGGMISQAQPAQASAAPATKPQNFSWNPVDMNKYSRGLLSLAQSS